MSYTTSQLEYLKDKMARLALSKEALEYEYIQHRERLKEIANEIEVIDLTIYDIFREYQFILQYQMREFDVDANE